MRVRARLAIATSVACGAALVVGGILATVLARVDALERASGEHLELVRDTAALELLTHEYFFEHREGLRTQWHRAFETVAAGFARMRRHAHAAAAAAELEPVPGNLRELAGLFAAAGERQPAGRIFVLARGLAAAAAAAEERTRRETIALVSRARTLVLALFGGLIVFLAISSLTFGRSIIAPLRRLRGGIAIVSAGDLGHRIGRGRDDEFGDLARSFDEMTGRLATELSSRDDLEREVVFRRRAEAERAAVLRTMLDHFWVVDGDGRIVEANDAFCLTLGCPREELVGKAVSDLEVEESRVLTADTMRRIMAEGSGRLETRHRRKDGGVVDLEVSLRHDPDLGDNLWVFSRDVTDHKRREAQLQRAREDLERSNKELEQFAYVASHDLQEPLRMVSSYTQLLAQRFEGQLDEKAQKFVHYAVDGAVRMQRLINDLLAFSRVGSRGKVPEPTDAHAALGEARRNLARLLEENQAILTNDDLPTLPADAAQLALLFQNLVANAVKFRGPEPPHVHVSARDAGSEWIFSVRDNGIGIDPRYADRIFVIFQRLHTREEYPGTGIGLAICKRIAERHGGRIWFEPTPGGGATFLVALPKQAVAADV